MIKLNLGCGTVIKEGWINIDIIKGKGVDMLLDLNKIPYKQCKKSSVDEIYCRMTLPNLDINSHEFMKEAYRILKVDGKLTIIVPHFSCIYAFHETHNRFYRYNSLRHFKNDTFLLGAKEFNNFDEFKRHLSFERTWYLFFNPLVERLANKHPHLYEGTFLNSLFPAYNLEVIFIKK